MGKKKAKTFVENIKNSHQKSRLDNSRTSEARADGWMNVLTGLGICGRDKKMNGRFAITKIFDRAELDMMYRSDGMLRRIIDMFSEEMTRQGFEIEGDTQGDIMSQLSEMRAMMHITNLIKWSRLYGGGICIIGIDDGLPIDQPVDEPAIRSVQWLRTFDRYQAWSRDGTFESDLNSPNYGFPSVYTVNDNRTGAIFYVHYTRVLRMDWNILPPRWQNFNQGWGDPLVQSMYEELRNYSQAFSNTATIMEDFVNAIIQIPNLSQIMASQGGDNTVLKRLNLLALTKSNASMMIMDAEEKYDKVHTNVTGIADLIDRFMLQLSAVCGIPCSLLFGRTATGLNATGDNDVRNFYDAVKQSQETKLLPQLEKLIRYLFLAKDGPYEGIEPENWKIQFVPLWQNTQEQEALVRKVTAETDAIYLDRGVLDSAEVAISRFGGNHYSTNTIIDTELRKQQFDPQEIQNLEKEKEELQESPEIQKGPDVLQQGETGASLR